MAQGAAVTVACAATRQILFKNPQVYITGLKQNCLGKVEKILKGNLDLINLMAFNFRENSNYGQERLLEV